MSLSQAKRSERTEELSPLHGVFDGCSENSAGGNLAPGLPLASAGEGSRQPL